MSDLASRSCPPCTGATPTLTLERVRELLPQVPGWWLAADGRRLARTWRAKDFRSALAFFARVADLADAEDHHPDLHLTNYRDVRLELMTHAANGLTENDFVLAAKINGVEPPV